MKDRRELLTVIGLVGSGALVALVGAFLLVLPQRGDLKKANSDFDQVQTQILSIRASTSGGSSLHAGEIFQLSRAMPVADDMPGIILALSRAAHQSSTVLMSVRPAVRVALPDGSAAVPLQIVINGSFGDIAHFLRIVRSEVSVAGQHVRVGSRLFVTDTLSMTANSTTVGATGPKGEVTANLSLVAFDYGAPPAAGSTAGVAAAPGAGGSSSSSSSSSTSASAAAATTGGN